MSTSLLIVDDSTSMRQMVAFALASGGYDVHEAEDGQAALDLAREAVPVEGGVPLVVDPVVSPAYPVSDPGA